MEFDTKNPTLHVNSGRIQIAAIRLEWFVKMSNIQSKLKV